MTTCPLRQQYLELTLHSLEAAGFPTPKIISDGPSIEMPRMGPKSTFKRALHAGVRNRMPFVVVQDDVLVSKGLHGYLEHGNIPATGILSLYSSAKREPDERGWHRQEFDTSGPTPPWYLGFGACGYLFKPTVAADYLASDYQMQRNDMIGPSLAEFCCKQGIPYWLHSPSFVQHIGEESVRSGIPVTAERKAGNFLENVQGMY